MIPCIETGTTLVFTWVDGTPKQVSTSHKNFKEISALVKGATTFEEYVANVPLIEELLTPIIQLERIASLDDSELFIDDNYHLSFKVDGNTVSVPRAVATSIVSIQKAGGNLEPMVRFLRKLVDNPNKNIADQLWGFIQSCGLCLTLEGNFLAYKNVNNDFTSVWDGETDNSPGTTLEMPRKGVEHNPDKTCSRGLHFAAWGYLASYAPGRKTVLVSVSPEDVVSVPTDYNNQKGRACKYKVVREVAQPEELKGTALFTEKH